MITINLEEEDAITLMSILEKDMRQCYEDARKAEYFKEVTIPELQYMFDDDISEFKNRYKVSFLIRKIITENL